MALYIKGRYVCDTCSTVFIASMKPIIQQPRKIVDDNPKFFPPMDSKEALGFVEFVKRNFDRYWWGSQGITTEDFLKGITEYAEWRNFHRGHRIRLLRHNQTAPDYREESKSEWLPKLSGSGGCHGA